MGTHVAVSTRARTRKHLQAAPEPMSDIRPAFDRSYWIAMAICLFFMVLVNGWLTKLSAPIVQYDPGAKTPWRFPWDIPVEDYLFGFALLTAVIARWKVAARVEGSEGGEPCPQQLPSRSRSSASS